MILSGLHRSARHQIRQHFYILKPEETAVLYFSAAASFFEHIN